MSEPEPTPREALLVQLATIRGNEPRTSYFELRPFSRDMQPAARERTFIPVGQINEAIERIFEQGHRLNAYVGAAPRVREDGHASAVERVWCLWADLDGPEALAALAKFRPAPTMTIASGTLAHAHALWSLNEPLSPALAQRYNRGLARALHGDMNATDPARILRPVGSVNHKHTPPRPVACTRLTLDMFTAGQVVAGLPDSRHYLRPPNRVLPAITPSSPSAALAGLVRTVSRAQDGNRNAMLYWAACRAREKGLDVEAASAELRSAAVGAGLPETEVEGTIRSALEGPS